MMNRLIAILAMTGAILVLAGTGWATSAPQNLQATDGDFYDYITLTWSPMSGVNQFYIEASYTRDFSNPFYAGNAPGNQFFQWFFVNSISGTPFFFRVRADGSPYSLPNRGYGSGLPNPSPGVTAYLYNGQLIANWSVPQGGYESFDVYDSHGANSNPCRVQNFVGNVFGHQTPSHNWINLGPAVSGTVHRIGVRTLNPNGASSCTAATYVVP